MTHRRYVALLFITVFLNSVMAGFATNASIAFTHDRSYELVPPMPQFSSEAASLNFTIPYPVPRPSPVSGEISVLVIAVEFKDYNHTLSVEQVADQTIKPLNDYYGRISYGAATIVGKVVGWIKLPHSLNAYGWDNGPFVDDQDGDGYPDSWRLLRDAIPIVVKQVDVSAYQQILVIHAGFGQESSRDPNDIWSVTYMRWTVEAAQHVFERFAVVPEFEARNLATVGVYTHEFGHLLGLPDLYSNTMEQVGPWDLMARGAWNGKPPGSSPSEMIAWDRMFLGWLTPDRILNITQQTKVNATIDPIEVPSSGAQVARVRTSSLDSKHYYLVEVRQKIGYDAALPSSGVLITYIDETKSNPVKVIDAMQTTSTLDDAPFQVGQKYLDGQNNLIISVVSTNNSSYSVLFDTLAPAVDIAVENLTLNPPTVHPNVTASLNIQVANEGTLKAKLFFVAIYLNDTLFASRRIALGAGESQLIQLSWTPKQGGTYFFKVTLDPEKALTENNRENNLKTVRVVVGFTLTLEVRPSSGGEDMQWWLIVNGNNDTYAGVGEFQIGVLPGANTIQIQPTVYLNPNSRLVFRQWSDGSIDNPRTIQVSSDMSLGADFNAQYLLSLDLSGGAASGAGWYDPGTVATVTATSPSSVVTDQSRLVFLSWSGDAQSESAVLVVNMTRPYALKANWKTQYYLNVQSPYAAAGGGWYDANAQAIVSLNSPVVPGNGVRYVFLQWSGDLSGATQSQSITMSGPKTVSALWATQYELRMESDYGHTSGAGWYDPGAQAAFGVDTLIIDTANDTRRVFTGWSGDASGSSQQGAVSMDGPKSIRADWTTQYLVTLSTKGVRNGTVVTIVLNDTPHQVKVPEAVQLWLDTGSSASFSANATVSEGFRRYVFQEWKNSTGGAVESPQSILEPEKYTATYRELSMFPCIIATVTFGSEVTPEVQFLRSFRDRLVLSTRAGSAFMNVFNSWYYSFSPQVADFIVSHDIMRNPLRFVLYPLLGILELSSATYSELSFMPELAITVAGILASALIGITYLTPISLLLARLLRRKGVRCGRVLRAYLVSLLVAATALFLGELTGSFWMLAVATSVLVLTTAISSSLLFSLELTTLTSGLRVFARMKTILRIR